MGAHYFATPAEAEAFVALRREQFETNPFQPLPPPPLRLVQPSTKPRKGKSYYPTVLYYGKRIHLGAFATKEDTMKAMELAQHMRDEEGMFNIHMFKKRAKAAGLVFQGHDSVFGKGVSKSSSGKFVASIMVNGKAHRLGCKFLTAEAAAQAYNLAKNFKEYGAWDINKVRARIADMGGI